MFHTAQCPTCSFTHQVPRFGNPRPGVFNTDPVSRGLSNVYYACEFSKDCGTAIAGESFKKFSQETDSVSANFVDKKMTLLSINGFDGEREMSVDELQVAIINKFKEVMNKK